MEHKFKVERTIIMTKSDFINKISENNSKLMKMVNNIYLEDPDVELMDILELIFNNYKDTILFVSSIDEKSACIEGVIELPEFMSKKRA